MCANDGSTKAALACRVTSPDFYNEFDVRVVCYLEVAVVEIVGVAAAEVGDLFGAVAAVEFVAEGWDFAAEVCRVAAEDVAASEVETYCFLYTLKNC